MKKRIEITTLVFFIISMLVVSVNFTNIFSFNNNKSNEDNWNKGFCENDGTRLVYYGTSNKEIYICPTCGQYYKFNQVMSYK